MYLVCTCVCMSICIHECSGFECNVYLFSTIVDKEDTRFGSCMYVCMYVCSLKIRKWYEFIMGF